MGEEVLRPPPSLTGEGITRFRLHRFPEEDHFELELPNGDTYDLAADEAERWLRFSGVPDAAQLRLLDYVQNMRHAEYRIDERRIVPLSQWPDPEVWELRGERG